MDLVHYIYRKYPNLRRNLVMAHLKISPLVFIKKMLVNALMLAAILSFFCIFILDRYLLMNGYHLPRITAPAISLFVIFPLLFTIVFSFLCNAPLGTIQKRRKDIDKVTDLFLGFKLSSLGSY